MLDQKTLIPPLLTGHHKGRTEDASMYTKMRDQAVELEVKSDICRCKTDRTPMPNLEHMNHEGSKEDPQKLTKVGEIIQNPVLLKGKECTDLV